MMSLKVLYKPGTGLVCGGWHRSGRQQGAHCFTSLLAARYWARAFGNSQGPQGAAAMGLGKEGSHLHQCCTENWDVATGSFRIFQGLHEEKMQAT